ncbi:hypothetical protein [Streptomyces sp. NBC_00236]|uniref:hypothetical protein n=1 Tax=Streptomyces sp. NBC_00236 TaxID=2903639 RepID=UPI002E2967B3|nr:hypothetical protein [Streptomyces sp. NBC_00236]
MMPETATTTRIAPQPMDVTTLDIVMGLTGAERAVALYVSDMPSGRRRHSDEQVRAWIAQGVERLGREETARWGAFFRGYRLLDLSGLVTVQIQQRHEQRFPKTGRLVAADQQAANSVYGDRMSEETRLRNHVAEVDGDCPCRGTRRIRMNLEEGCDSLARMCPVHAQDAIRRMARA